jgi:ribosome recycling factor
MVKEVHESCEESMMSSLESLINELKKIRTGRASVSMLDSVKVNYYGTLSPLSQVASITCPDAKSFVITPWEASVLKDIEAAIVKSDIGMSPMNDGRMIRLKVPELTEERRKELVKQVKKIIEEARISVRAARRDANEAVKKMQKNKEISEDELKRSNDDIQKLTDNYIAKVDQIGDEKEKDLMTI